MTTAFHIDEIYLAHATPDGHPERPARVRALLPLAARAGEIGVRVLPARREATDAELARVHTREHLATIAATARRAGASLDPDTFTSARSHEVARYAAGAVLDLVDRVVGGELDNAFAAVRPPGHHAEKARAMGFCLFNNVAAGAAHALAHHGLERVLVIDWDVHHGNGTQAIFWDDPRVLYVSLHQFPYYPGTGAARETGGAGARGRTVNVPMPAGFGDAEWVAAFRRVVAPVARSFSPQLILVSAGFDAHVRDPLGGMRVTESGFATMTREAVALAGEHAGGRLVAVLEGGYDVEALAGCVESVLRRMSGALGAEREPADEGDFGTVLAAVRAAHCEHWPI